MTQKELGLLVNSSPRTVSSWELGNRKPPNETLTLFSEIFGVSVDYLLDNCPPEIPSIDVRGLTRQQIYALGIVAEQFRRDNQ